jgi:hypothetical protein
MSYGFDMLGTPQNVPIKIKILVLPLIHVHVLLQVEVHSQMAEGNIQPYTALLE